MLHPPSLPNSPSVSNPSTVLFRIPYTPSTTKGAIATTHPHPYPLSTTLAATAAAAATATATATRLFRTMAPSDRPRHHYSVFPVTSQRSHDSPTTITSNINSSSTSDGSGGSGSNGDGNGNGNGDDNNTSRSPLNMVEEPPPPQPLIAAPHIRSVYSMQDTLDSLYDEWVTIDIVFRSLQGAFPARLPPAEREEEYLDEIDRELSITYDDLMAQVRRLHRNLNRLAREMAHYSDIVMESQHRQY